MSRAYVGIVLVALLGCCGSGSQPRIGLPSGEAAEALAGAQAAPAVELRFGGVVRDVDAERRMETIGLRLTRVAFPRERHLQYRLLDSDRPNAVSLPGGYIYITRGLYGMLSSEDLLAATLAHEIAHLASKDHFRTCPPGTQCAQDKELSADSNAVRFLDEAGYRSPSLIDLLVLVRSSQPAGWAAAREASIMRQLECSHKLAAHRRSAALNLPRNCR